MEKTNLWMIAHTCVSTSFCPRIFWTLLQFSYNNIPNNYANISCCFWRHNVTTYLGVDILVWCFWPSADIIRENCFRKQLVDTFTNSSHFIPLYANCIGTYFSHLLTTYNTMEMNLIEVKFQVNDRFCDFETLGLLKINQKMAVYKV